MPENCPKIGSIASLSVKLLAFPHVIISFLHVNLYSKCNLLEDGPSYVWIPTCNIPNFTISSNIGDYILFYILFFIFT